MVEGTVSLQSAPGYFLCEQPIDGEFVQTIRHPASNYQGDATNADELPAASAWGFGVMTTGATTRFENSSVANPEIFLFQGVNEAPPTQSAPALQIDRLRMYTQEFGGTSAAAAMMTGVVARMQAASKQFFGTPLTPTLLRDLLENHPGPYIDCLCARYGNFAGDFPFFDSGPGLPFGANSCANGVCTGGTCLPPANLETCDCIDTPVGVFPNLQQLPATILSSSPGGNGNSGVDVITGGRLVGYAWSPFQVRAVDANYLQIVAERMNAGTTREGLTYLSTGLTTDVRVRRQVDLPNPATDLVGLAVRSVTQSTRNFVVNVAFIRNFATNRYEYVGVQLLNNAVTDTTFQVVDTGAFERYINPSTNEVEVRVWTCGLGAVGRHTIRHDYIEIVLNPPFQPL
jgi:hypothetical protein